VAITLGARGLDLWRPEARRAAALPITGLLAFRWLVIACQAATIWITWPLWQQRDSPPLLPVFTLPGFDLGLPLLATLAVVLFAPVLGMGMHTVLLLYAILLDQTRLQPEIVSLAFLLWGTLPNLLAQSFARAHLIAMWTFSGFNKLISPKFFEDIAPWMLKSFPVDPNSWLHAHFGYIVALSEMSIGLLALVPATRKLSAVMAFGVHAGILLVLSPLANNWNISVWPWNVALAFAGFALIAPWKESVLASLSRCHRMARPVLLILLLSPIGYYFGMVDAYLAHHLYSANIPTAMVSCPVQCPATVDPSITWLKLNVPLPPEHRLFEQYFRLTCQPGDEMVIDDPRWWYDREGQAKERLTCPNGA